MEKHTAGPWEVSKHGVPDGFYQAGIYADNGRDLAIVTTSAEDASLIAAAPDLLAALEDLFEHCVMVHKHWGEGSNAREADAAQERALAAIAKARGN